MVAKIIRIFHVFILSVFFLTQLGLADDKESADKAETNSWTPILQLPSAGDNALIGEEMLRDPRLAQTTPADDMGAAQLMQEIKNLKAELKYTKGPHRNEILHELYRNIAAYSYFAEDVAKGKIESEFTQEIALRKLKRSRTDLIRQAVALTKSLKDKKVKSRAMYHVLVARYYLGINPEIAIKNLGLISKNLTPDLVQRVQFLAAYHQINFGDRALGQQEFIRLLPILSRSSKLTANLNLAQSFAGLDNDGKKTVPTDKRYTEYLNAAVQLAPGLSPIEKENLFERVVGIWTATEGDQIDWSKPVFAVANFDKSVGRFAILEREAIQSIKNGDSANAQNIYRRLSKSLEGKLQLAAIDQRILDLQIESFKRTRNIVPVETLLMALEKKYRNAEVLGTGHKKQAIVAHQNFAKQYRNFVYNLIQKAQQKDASNKIHNEAIAVGSHYEKLVTDEKDHADLMVSIAQLHVVENHHKEAVAIYMNLVTKAKKDKLEYLSPAMVSQRILADWPDLPPWTNIPKGKLEEQSRLREMYTKLNEINGTTLDWNALAHEGLLYISINQLNNAFTLWEKNLAKDPQNDHAARAAGLMLVVNQKQKNWSKVESIARTCLQNKIIPLAGKGNLNTAVLLGDALYFGGKIAFNEKRYAVAAKKLAEFTKIYKNDDRRDESLNFLGLTYHANNQHPESLAALTQLVKEYPKSKYQRDALLNGGSWATAMAAEEPTIFFYQRFLNQFREDSQSSRVRHSLISLYLARQLYANASRLILEQGQVKGATKAEKLDAAFTYMDIEERYGDRDKARIGAKMALDVAPKDQSVQATVIAFEARQARIQNQIQKLNELEKQLISMNPSLPEVTEALGYVRFQIQEMNAKKPTEAIFNIGDKDPVGTLKKQYNVYALMAAPYQRICNHPEVPECGPAMMRLSQATNEMIKQVQVITIPESLDTKTVNDFKQMKAELIRYLTKEAREAGSKAEEVLTQGHAHPDLAQEILWVNSNDWNFDRITGEGGKGYVQWSATATTRSNSKSTNPVTR